MPVYAKMQTTSFGEFFLKCATKGVAGTTANSEPLGDDSINVLSHGWDINSVDDGNRNHSVYFSIHLEVPALPPAMASCLNTMGGNDVIKELVLIKTGDNASVYGAKRNSVSVVTKATNGRLINSSFNEREKGNASMTLNLEFEELDIDNKVSNTSGVLCLTNGGQ